MKQVFYIERDEEITSLVDKLRRSRATENVFVLPERAIVLQSIVSLKLLKKESEKLSKKISILTTNQQERLRVEKSEITLESSEGIEKEEIVIPAKEEELLNNSITNSPKISIEKVLPKKVNRVERLDNLGTNNFFGEGERSDLKINSEGNKINLEAPKPEIKNDNLPNKENVFKSVDNLRKEKMFSEITKEKITSKPLEFGSAQNVKDNNFQYSKSFDSRKEEIVKDFFNPQQPPQKDYFPRQIKNEPKKETSLPVSGGIKKFFVIFSIICFLAIAGVLAFVLLPKAKVIVTAKNNYIEKDFEIKGDKNAIQSDFVSMVVPIRTVESEDSIDYEANATGSKSSANKKSHGKVVIYNEFNSDPQQLVATTRLATEDGKIFRITKGVTVPGMSSVGGKNNPGAVEVDVIADQSGTDYNISASDFKIPGFEGSPKYDKFYAKSTEAMTGGGEDANSGIKIISQKDLDQAKKNAEEQMKSNLIEKVKKELKQGEILLDESSEVNILESKTTSKANDATQKFSYKIKASVKSIVFLESDVKNLFLGLANNKELSMDDVSINYGQSTPDFANSTIEIKAHGKIDDKNQIDGEKLKNELLGKNEEKIKEILSNYPNISGIDLELWPQFMSTKIPKNANRVELQIN